MEKIKMLKEDYEQTAEIIRQELPKINLNSKKEILLFFEQTFKIELKSSKIKEIAGKLQRFQEDTPEHDLILAIVHYMKIKYTIKNYLNCIITHQKGGTVQLRDYFGLALPNRQPLPASEEIMDCIVDGSLNAMKEIEKNRKKNVNWKTD